MICLLRMSGLGFKQNFKMVKQGDIFFADLSPTKGFEQSGFRPVLVLQNDILNENLNTVIVAPITSNLKSGEKLITFYLESRKSGLPRDSVVLLFQVRTIDKVRLKKRVSCLPADLMHQILRGFNLAF